MAEPLPPDAPAAADGAAAGPATRLIHHPYRAPAGFESPVVPVAKASTVFFDSVAAMHATRWVDKSGYTYGLHGTPTTFTLEARLATLEGASQVLLAPSGLAAIALVDQALLGPGDAMLLPDNVYAPSRNLAEHELKRWGVSTQAYDPLDAEAFGRQLGPATRLIWLEAAGSVTLEFPDLRGLVATARRLAPQALIALDNTWGAGLAFDAFDLGPGPDGQPLAVDLSVHALTKYPAGGGDLLMGSVACRDPALHARLAAAHGRLGLGVGANDVEAVLRGLPSLPLRYAAQDAAARALAAHCAAQAATPGSLIRRVLHPARPDSPGHAHWAALCRAAAGLLTLEFAPEAAEGPRRAERFVEALRHFRIGYSWGGPVSLAVPYEPTQIRPAGSPFRGPLVRLCIGLEDVADLIADVDQALVCAAR